MTPLPGDGRLGRQFIWCAGLALVAGLSTDSWAALTVQDLVNQFSVSSYQNLVSNRLYTRAGMNRANGGAQHDLCRDAIYGEMLNAGLAATKDIFTYYDTANNPRTACNVLAIKPGVQNPNNEIYVIGSHYDSKSNPGADDNATGVACLLEMARIYSQCYFARTLVFCAFDAEEISDYYGAHRLGSVRYADQHRTDNIKGMISVDMVGWQSAGTLSNHVNLESRSGMAAIRDTLTAAVQNFGGGLVVNPRSPGDYSDHVAFADAGFQACLVIESDWANNPNYHKATDYVEMPGYIDWSYVSKVCRSVIGFYATQLEIVDVTPEALSVTPGTNGAMNVTFRGLPGCQYAAEMTTNLTAPVWTPLTTNTASATDGFFAAADPQTGSRPATFYRARFVAGASGRRPAVDLILDNRAATVVGTWSTGTSSVDKYGTDYRFASPGTGSAYVEFRPTLPTSGDYRVYEWHPAGSNRTTEAPVEVTCNVGVQTLRINQQIRGGQWNLLGVFTFSAGTEGHVRITDNFVLGSVVLADAIRFTSVE